MGQRIMFMKSIRMNLIRYNEFNFLNSLDEFEKKNLQSKLEEKILNFSSELSYINSNITNTLSMRNTMINKIIVPAINLAVLKTEDAIGTNYFKQFNRTYLNYSTYLTNLHQANGNPNLKDLLFQFSKITENLAKESIFEIFLFERMDSTAIYIKDLKYYHLTSLLNTTIKFVYYDNANSDLLKEAHSFHFKIIKYCPLNIAATKDLKTTFEFRNLSPNINLIAMSKQSNNSSLKDYYFDLRTPYNQIDYYPDIKEIIKRIKRSIQSDSEIYITLSIFLETPSPVLTSNHNGYLKSYFKFNNYYDYIINEVTELSKDFKVNYLIPNSMYYKDYIWWYTSIKDVLATKAEKEAKVGLILEDDEMAYELEEIGHADIVVIDFDELTYEYTEDLEGLTYDEFKDNVIDLIRPIHSHLKYKKITHPIKSLKVNNSKIFEKLIMMGFTDFIYPPSSMRELTHALNSYMSRRGKYVGLSKAKPELSQ